MDSDLRSSASLLPDIADGEPDEEACSTALVHLREVAPDLRPPPDRSIDETVDRWLVIAEETMFECPPDDAAYIELGNLADEVGVVVYDS